MIPNIFVVSVYHVSAMAPNGDAEEQKGKRSERSTPSDQVKKGIIIRYCI